ncbi:MAG: DEAD/DEAH box helicase, partial [Coriobacteriia bacterium]|nr:DEAD/DEAH box helicase [Coriobacteriia bacterium]
RTGTAPGDVWARLGNAFALFDDGLDDGFLHSSGVSRNEAAFFSSTAFYCGGFPASAYVALKSSPPDASRPEETKACFDLIVRPPKLTSRTARSIKEALLTGEMGVVKSLRADLEKRVHSALLTGPNEWIVARMLEGLLDRFESSNVRAVLPGGDPDFWTPLVRSMVNRAPPIWEFFPSQVEAFGRGLLDQAETFSLQMPTGAGKTALCETLLYWHATKTPEAVAILLVPYRSLASELRNTLVKRLNAMGIASRCAYASTIPASDEVSALEETRVMVATPEALSGLLSVDHDFMNRISLVICDEGHLLDSGDRGVNLELLLARLRARECGAPRFVFMSAIVPNIEEINTWLGGKPESVVRSDYRPALAEYSVLKPSGSGARLTVDLVMHPQTESPTRFEIAAALSPQEFAWTNPASGRINSYSHTTVKTQAVAIARKAMRMGASVIFSANKRGIAGAIGIAEETLKQLDHGLPLPDPKDYANQAEIGNAIDYLASEYGASWVCCRALDADVVLHHGDIPQETRDVLERLLRQGHVRLAICTNTLAEGVNFPIRTLVLYSVRRKTPDGRAVDLLTRDIKNLVGRAGRPGSTTRGLVVCANPRDWLLVEHVAKQVAEEPVDGALRRLVERLQNALATQRVELTNEILEETRALQSLTDGIDSTLIDLAAEEIGATALAELAVSVARETFAFERLVEHARSTLEQVFELRAQRVSAVQARGRLSWIRETGARMRLIEVVESDLLPRLEDWSQPTESLDPHVVDAILQWAWGLGDVQAALRAAYEIGDDSSTDMLLESFLSLVMAWLSGSPWQEVAAKSGRSIDDTLRVHAAVVSYVLQANIEHGIALLGRLLDEDGLVLAPVVEQFPTHLRFGVPSQAGCLLAGAGVAHRSACVEFGRRIDAIELGMDRDEVVDAARDLLFDSAEKYEELLGALVFRQTAKDLAPRRRN